MKWSRETRHNLPYFWNTKTHVHCYFRFSFRATLFFPLMDVLVYVDIDQGIHQGINKVVQNNKKTEKICSRNMANFEAFHWAISSSINMISMKSVLQILFTDFYKTIWANIFEFSEKWKLKYILKKIFTIWFLKQISFCSPKSNKFKEKHFFVAHFILALDIFYNIFQKFLWKP